MFRNINRDSAQTMRAILNSMVGTSTVKKLLAEQGIKLEVGSGRYTTTEITFKVTMTLADEETGEVQSQERQALKHRYPGLVDREIRVRSANATGRIIEYHSRKHKFPFIVEMPNGKRFKLTKSYVEQQMGLS